MTLFNARSSITKSFVASVLVAGSLMAAANAATAASLSAPHGTSRAAYAMNGRVPIHTANRRAASYGQYGFDIGGFIQAMLGGPLPPQYAQIVRGAMNERGRYATSRGTYVPSYELPTYSDPAPIDNSASDAAAAAAAAAAQAASDTLANSMQAAQEQNDEANAETNADIAAAQQIEINAGN